MCGIIGAFNAPDAEKKVEKGLKILKNRGKDGSGLYCEGENCLGHRLHSVVSFVPQPFSGRGSFAANCEIYNWREFGKGSNDAETVFNMVEKNGFVKCLDKLDGVYAFAYWINNNLYLARDILGVKPLWYSHADGFFFASEKKALEALGCLDIKELNPRKILKYNILKDRTEFIQRNFFSLSSCNKEPLEKIIKKLSGLVLDAVSKRIPERKFGILFSGGIDSSLIALICRNLGKDFTCYCAGVADKGKEPEDITYAKKVARDLGLELKVVKVKFEKVESYLEKVVPLIEDSNVVKVGVALPFFAACEQAKKDGVKAIFSGLGAEELFAGYQRHKDSTDINKECLSGLLKMYERDLYRDDVVTMHHGIELRLPFLDKELTEFSLKIPGKYKLAEGYGKWILRKVAENQGLPEAYAWRKKRAAQYGSKFDKAIAKLAKKSGTKYKSEYLRRFYPRHNLKLVALISSGKDSLYATYVMKKQNYEITCGITLLSKNPDSFMFHTPNVDLVKLQAKAMGIPLIEQVTEGEKEVELGDLKKALETAKKKYKIDGVITGALFSNYQRGRVEKLADSLGLKIFSPLWHINQETLMREIIEEGFEVVLSSVAAEGLDKSWLGKKLDDEMVDRLVKLNEKIGINIAFEGGEAESLVLNCPLFSRRIEIEDYEIIEENKNVARMIVKKAKLV